MSGPTELPLDGVAAELHHGAFVALSQGELVSELAAEGLFL